MNIFSKKTEPSEISEDFFYQFTPGKDFEGDQKNSDFLGLFISAKKIKILFAILLSLIVLLLARSFQLQVVRGAYYEGLAENNRSRVVYLHATRGLIYDSKGKSLVENEPLFYISLVPANLPYAAELRKQRLELIAAFIGINQADLEAAVAVHPLNFKQPIVVKENLAYEDALSMAIKLDQYAELSLDTVSQRYYTQSPEFSHLLGYIGKINQEEYDASENGEYLLADYIGKSGLEYSYEKDLRGSNGVRQIEVDAKGGEKKVIFQREAQSGQSLVLNIDSVLQSKVYDLTKDFLHKIGKTRASVIMMRPDGGILSIVSYPSYDNNLFVGGISQENYETLTKNPNLPLFNRAIQGEYPSGSTIKMAVASAALEENVINEKTSFLSTGGLWIAGTFFFPDWKAGGHGYTNVYKAISDSVNTFFYIIGGGYQDIAGLGVARLGEYFKKFGFGSPTGIDLAGERSGLVPDEAWKLKVKNEQWYIGDTYHMAIGQGDVLTTPLQIANYTAVYANGGTLYTPRLVQSLIQPDKTVKQVVPEVIRKDFIDPYNISIIKKAMRRTITEGSGRYLASLPVEVAGKTGTAQFSETKQPQAWFTGFAPYEKPEVVLTVLIEEGGEGSAVSVPLASEILSYYFGEYKQQEVGISDLDQTAVNGL